MPVLGIRQQHDRSQNQEESHCAKDQAGERSSEIGFLFGRHHFAPGSLATRAFDRVSFWLILGITSRPSTTRPKTVWTPFRCRVFASFSTMKNWLPPVSFPACAIDSAPT